MMGKYIILFSLVSVLLCPAWVIADVDLKFEQVDRSMRQRDYAKAIKWLHKAAEQGHAQAQNHIALMYYAGGEGVSWPNPPGERPRRMVDFQEVGRSALPAVDVVLHHGGGKLIGLVRVDAAALHEGQDKPSPPAPVPGDLDANGAVDADDLIRVLLDWGMVHTSSDINADGIVAVDDLVIVIINWG